MGSLLLSCWNAASHCSWMAKPHQISYPSSTKACSKVCYFSAEALLAACCLSMRAGLPWQLSQITPAALPAPLHTQSCPALTTGFLLHWGPGNSTLSLMYVWLIFSPSPSLSRWTQTPFIPSSIWQWQGIYAQYTRMDRGTRNIEPVLNKAGYKILLALKTTTTQNFFVF